MFASRRVAVQLGRVVATANAVATLDRESIAAGLRRHAIQPYKAWAKVFNDDATLASAVLDRLLNHNETVLIEGRSYRMKDQIESAN